MKVEIWSDVVCPWCYIGKRRFEVALRRFADADQVEVEWRAFGSTRRRRPPPRARALTAPTGWPASTAPAAPEPQQMLDSMTQAAAAEGLDFRFDRAAAANTSTRTR